MTVTKYSVAERVAPIRIPMQLVRSVRSMTPRGRSMKAFEAGLPLGTTPGRGKAGVVMVDGFTGFRNASSKELSKAPSVDSYVHYAPGRKQC